MPNVLELKYTELKSDERVLCLGYFVKIRNKLPFTNFLNCNSLSHLQLMSLLKGFFLEVIKAVVSC
jgi:hypothetical protein